MPSAKSAMPRRAAFVSSIIRPRPLPSDGPASSLASPDSRNASASTNSISPEATERVPSLSFSLRTRTPLREPSRRVRSTRKVATPRLVSGAPSGLPSTTNASPLQFDANHLNPLSSHASPLRVAVVSSAPRSDPPVRSVSSWAVCAFPFTRLELGKHVVTHIGWRVRRNQRLHHAAAGAERAAHPDVGLVEQIVRREQWQRRAHACAAGVVAQCLLGVQHGTAGFVERRRHDDAADVVAPPVVAFEPRRVAVGLLGPPRDRALPSARRCASGAASATASSIGRAGSRPSWPAGWDRWSTSSGRSHPGSPRCGSARTSPAS